MPENPNGNLAEEINIILNKIDPTVNCNPDITPFRLGKATADKTRPVKIALKSTAQRNLILEKTASTSGNSKEVSFGKDYAPLTNRERMRLRAKRRNLSKLNIKNNYKIEEGILYENGIQIDKFNIENQLFNQETKNFY